MSIFFKDDGGTLKEIPNDEGNISLVDHLRKSQIVNVHVEFLGVKHVKNIQQTLLSDSKVMWIWMLEKVEEIVSGNDSVEDDEKRMLHIPLINDYSDADEEREQARVKVSKYV